MSIPPLQELEAFAELIRQNYDVGQVQTPQLMPQVHQRRHRKLLIATDAGQFVIKTYSRDPYVLDALRFQHRLSDHLLKNELPVAHIMPGKNGKRIVEADLFALELQEYIVGASMPMAVASLTAAGDALGRFHHVCRDFPRPARDARMWRFSEAPRSTFANLYNLAKQESGLEVLDEYCNAIALFLHDAGKTLDATARNRFETGLIHGDWHGGNLLFREEALVGILDMELAGDGCYLEDLSYAISNLCVRACSAAEHLEFRVDTVLNNYQKYRKLSYHELIALYYAVGIKHVATVSFQIRQIQDKIAGQGPTGWMQILAEQCSWLAKEANTIRKGG